MSYELQCLALKQKDLTSTQKSILFYLAFRANPQGECWPTIQTMALETNFDRKSILKIIQELINKNLIIKTNEKKGKTKRTSVYKLNLNSPKSGTISSLNSPKFTHQIVPNQVPLNSPKFGTQNIYIEYIKNIYEQYQEYVSKFNADIKLGFKPKDEKPLNFTEWKEIDML
jgi:GntR family transcriptional regulator